VKESVAELKRVDWPTREQVVTYTTVVLICVVVLGTVIAAFDLGIAKLVVKIFA
jgi:preprotein translocase subunit SecE